MLSQSDLIAAIFDAFGGATELAKAINEPVTTVHSWKTSKHGIPRWRKRQILGVIDAVKRPVPSAALEYLANETRAAA